MKTFARTEDGKVVEVFRHPTNPHLLFDPSWVWIECPDDTRPHCSWSEEDGFFDNPPEPDYVPPLPPLEQRQAEIKAQVDRVRDEKLTGGFTHNFGAAGVHTLQTRDADDKINWLTSQAAYSAAVAMGAGENMGATFRSADNATFTVSYADGLAALLGMAAWGAAIFNRSWTLKDEIAAGDDAALDAIDVNSGWPA